MGNLALVFLTANLFCGILLPGDNSTMISTALLAGSIIAFCLWLVVRRKITLGLVNALQILMLAELLVPLMTTSLSHFWGNYLSFAYAAVSFLLWSNLVQWYQRRWISVALAVYAVILVGQIAWRSLEIVRQGTPSTAYKFFMVVPFGASNYLGGPLLILFFVFFCIRGQEISGRLAWVVLAALFVGMLLIHSRAALVALLFTLLGYLLSRARWRGTRTGVVVWTGLAFLLTIGGFVGALALVRRYGSLMVGLNFLTSYRIDVFESSWQAFLKHPWFGAGLGNTPPMSILGATFDMWRAHNFILDLLMFTGMAGMAVQGAIYILAARTLRIKAALSPWAVAGLFCLIAMLIDALAEPSVFTYKVDALLWMVIGIGYALSKPVDEPSTASSAQVE